MAKDHLSRKLAVILHADVVGSTSLVLKNEALAHERIQATFHRFSETISSYGGVTHELRGDALVAEFDRASDAVPAALAFQVLNREFNSKLDDDIQPQLRVGISLGEVIIADNTITGAGVVLAQRLEQLADSGGVVVQGAAYETVPQRLPFVYQSLGEQQVKGFDEPVRAYVVTLKTGENILAPDPQVTGVKSLQRAKRSPRFIAGVLGLLIIVGGGFIWWQLSVDREEMASAEPLTTPLPDKPSIAVLAFINLSGDSGQEYLSDGISESIITGLSQFSDLFVIARQSSFSYKGKAVKVQEIAAELGVQYILEGSVQKSDDKIRVTAQLIDANTGHHLWAQQYDRQWEDIFVLQDDITQHIIANISSFEGALEEATRRYIKQKAPSDLKAFDYLLLGRERFFLVTREENAKARELFQKSIEVDPNYSLGHTWLTWTHIVDATWGWTDAVATTLELATRHAQKAVELDNNEAQAHWALGSALLRSGNQPKVALAEYERALALSPNNADLLAVYGWDLPLLGRAEEGVELIKKAMRLNPKYPDWYGQSLIFALYSAKHYEEAIAVSKTINVRHIKTILDIAGSYAHADQLEEAKKFAARVLEKNPDFTLSWWREIRLYINPADSEHYFDGLRKAGLPE